MPPRQADVQGGRAKTRATTSSPTAAVLAYIHVMRSRPRSTADCAIALHTRRARYGPRCGRASTAHTFMQAPLHQSTPSPPHGTARAAPTPRSGGPAAAACCLPRRCPRLWTPTLARRPWLAGPPAAAGGGSTQLVEWEPLRWKLQRTACRAQGAAMRHRAGRVQQAWLAVAQLCSPKPLGLCANQPQREGAQRQLTNTQLGSHSKVCCSEGNQGRHPGGRRGRSAQLIGACKRPAKHGCHVGICQQQAVGRQGAQLQARDGSWAGG